VLGGRVELGLVLGLGLGIERQCSNSACETTHVSQFILNKVLHGF